MRVTLLVGGKFVDIKTGADGIAHGIAATLRVGRVGTQQSFRLVDAAGTVAARNRRRAADRGVVRAGETLRVVGFARKREGATFKPMRGEVRVSALVGGHAVANAMFQLEPSGGFWGALPIPQDTAAGELAIIATAGGGTGGTAVHVDAAGDYTLNVAALCGASCSASSAVPLRVSLRAQGNPVAGQVVQVRVVRTPHVIPPGENLDVPRWGTTTIQNTSVRTTSDGTALLTLPAPTDGLSSTYGVVASTQSATATTQIVVPNAATVVWDHARRRAARRRASCGVRRSRL